MPGFRESRFDAALDNATHAALAALGLRAENLIDTADDLNEEMEPIFRNWVDAAGETGIPDRAPDVAVAKTSPDALSLEHGLLEAARAAAGAFGIDPALAPETTEEIIEAIARVMSPYLIPEEPDEPGPHYG